MPDPYRVAEDSVAVEGKKCCPYNGNPPIHSVYWVCERPILKGLGVFL